jgi:UDP-GlcNAc:undecaprenyl-phosphate/decaprenyl-phosphate GlcNAc-1-phosphate transferase
MLALPFAVSMAAALALTPLARRVAQSLGMVAAPSADRWHERPTPLLGGAAIYIAFVAGAAVTWLLRGEAMPGGGPPAATTPIGISAPWVGVFLSATMMFAVGLVDDRLKLNPTTKLMAQAAAAAILISFGVVYPLTPWVVMNVLLTFFWFLALTNAMNLLDHMDGVAVGVAGVAAVFLGVTLYLDGAYVIAAATLALAGAAFGFLPYNFPRASIFMGDAGSMFIGALLAGLGAAYPNRVPSASLIAVLFVPAMIVIIPIVDTTLVTVTRMLAGRSVSAGGKDHTSHRLVAMGFSERQVPLVLYAVAVLGGIMALVLRSWPYAMGVVVGGVFLVALLLGLAYLARMQSYQPVPGESGRVTLMVSDLVHKRRALEVMMDLVLFALAYQAAFLIRWDGRPPAEQTEVFATTAAVVIAAKSAAFWMSGVYRGAWHRVGLADAQRIARATLFGTLLTTAALVFFFREQYFGRGVLVIDGLLVGAFTIAARMLFRSLDQFRNSLRRDGVPVVVYGAGRGGELAVRELVANQQLAMRPIGFIDDDLQKKGRLIQGLPVLGTAASLEAILRTHGVKVVVIGSRRLNSERLDNLHRVCAEFAMKVIQMELEFRPVTGESELEPPVHGDTEPVVTLQV